MQKGRPSMERNPHHFSLRFTSFSSPRDSNHREREIDRNLSLGSTKLEHIHARKVRQGVQGEGTIPEEEDEQHADTEEPESTTVYDDIDSFLGVLLSVHGGDPPEIPELTVDKFVALVKKEVSKYESANANGSALSSLLKAIERLSKLTSAAASFPSEPKYGDVRNRSSGVLHSAMRLLEDEFYSLLGGPRVKQDDSSFRTKSKRQPPLSLPHDPGAAPAEFTFGESPRPYPPETLERLRVIADAMIAGGYHIECCQVFAVARRNAFEAKLPGLGFEKLSMEEVMKMTWEHLEDEILTWIKAFKYTVKDIFSTECELYQAVFSGHLAVSDRLFREFAHSTIVQFLAFADAIAMTKRSTEKLFKVLDIYDALSDAMATVDVLLPDEAAVSDDPRTEIANVRHRLGEAAVAIFCDLESSIKTDSGKNPIRGGAIHPVTRYVVNYLQVAAEYKNTIEQVFKEHKNSEKPLSSHEAECGGSGDNPFAVQLTEVMNLLESNLETASKLYKDPSLRNIFLMNNGRYIAKKVKASPEIRQLLGETWYRQQSSELRKFHKNYQRETWSRVLACLRDEGLHNHKGSVAKPALKERFKSFNAMIDEIQKTQSSWVVSDEQMQSELRVSVSAVVVPAYRSFVGRFSQYLYSGRQTEKYIKYSAEDIENLIEELFEGKPCSASTKKRP